MKTAEKPRMAAGSQTSSGHWHVATYYAGQKPLDDDVFYFEDEDSAVADANALSARLAEEGLPVHHIGGWELTWNFFHAAGDDTIVIAVYYCWSTGCDTCNIRIY